MTDVEHYFPGKAITTLPYTVSYDSSFVDALAYSTDVHDPGYKVPGYDSAVPWAPAPYGFPDNSTTRPVQDGPLSAIIWNITGGGEEVTFDAMTTTTHDNGVIMYLFLPNSPAVSPYFERGWVKSASAAANVHATFTATLAPGEVYYLVVAAHGIDGYGSGGQVLYGLPYEVSVKFTDNHSGPANPHAAPANDLRANATRVVIPEIGDGTYLSTDTDLSYATPGSVIGLDENPDDPDSEATPLYQTCWWKYVPTQAGSATLRAHSNPADDVHVTVMILKGDLSAIHAGMVGHDIIFPVNAGDVYWIAIGTIAVSQSVSVSFGLNGPPTEGDVTPDPTGDLPPFNPGLDPFTPDAPQVPTAIDATKETRPLIDLIRDFSSKVKRAVRVLSVDTVPDPTAPLLAPYAVIELVNRSATNTMQSMDPEALYSAASDVHKAGETKVSMLGADNLREASSTLVNNDATILLSYWRIPDFLPLATVNGQPATHAPVKSVNLTFDGDGFSGSLEFYVG